MMSLCLKMFLSISNLYFVVTPSFLLFLCFLSFSFKKIHNVTKSLFSNLNI